MKHLSPLSLIALASATEAALNGFNTKPIMGYNSYNDVGCSPNEGQIRDAINAMADKNLAKLGYKYFQVDCGWQGFDRLPDGSITYDKSTFPNGIRPLSDLARSKGMRWSMYTDQGLKSCDTQPRLRPGSLGYETKDAAVFKSWNTEYVKVDNCYVDGVDNAPKVPREDFPSRFGVMSSALDRVNIKGMLVCQWGVPYKNASGDLLGPAQWTPPLATSFRASDDISDDWNAVMRITNQAIHINLKNLSGPGHWADMDLLEVGNRGMTTVEHGTHFAIWAAFKSALMISTNVPRMSDETYRILSNRDIIGVNQDVLGVPAKLVQRFTDDYDVYMGPIQHGDQVILLVDQSNKPRKLSIDFSSLGIASAVVKDLWTGEVTRKLTSFSKDVGAHGNMMLDLSYITYNNTPAAPRTYYQASTGSISGSATVQNCPGCSNGLNVGFITDRGGFTLSNVKTSKAVQDVLIDYANCEIGYLYGSLNQRRAAISVNGGPDQIVSFPISGYQWGKDLIQGYKVRLSGFDTSGPNTITVKGIQGGSFAPDFDRIGVLA